MRQERSSIFEFNSPQTTWTRFGSLKLKSPTPLPQQPHVKVPPHSLYCILIAQNLMSYVPGPFMTAPKVSYKPKRSNYDFEVGCIWTPFPKMQRAWAFIFGTFTVQVGLASALPSCWRPCIFEPTPSACSLDALPNCLILYI